MKLFSFLVLLILQMAVAAQLPMIHAHNDYEKPQPLINALQYKAFTIEADVYLINDTLRVAHNENKAAAAPTLNDLYIQPIVKLFANNKGTISADTGYSPILMIDIKKDGEAVLAVLIKQLSAYPSVFNRTVNPKAMQVVISGDRGKIQAWPSYPAVIMFDGRPFEEYDSAALKKIAFISDAYYNYQLPKDSADIKILQLVQQTHGWQKPLRLWAIPDNPVSWKHLIESGVDIINTDKVKACYEYFYKKD